MRWVTAIAVALFLVSLVGCGRLRTGQQAEISTTVSSQSEKSSTPTAPTKSEVRPQAATASPTLSPAAGPRLTLKTPPSPPPSPPTASEGATQTTQKTAELSSPPSPATAIVEQKVAAPLWTLTDDARSLRAALDSLRSQFDRLSPEEVRTRLLLLQQGLSELETRSPALVLWRTALRLETLRKAATPDVTLAQAWLQRVRPWLAETGVGLTAWETAMKSLRVSRWTEAVNALRDAADRLRASEQLEALTQARASLLNASEALERHKPAVAKAEVEEGLRAIDQLLPLLSPP